MDAHRLDTANWAQFPVEEVLTLEKYKAAVMEEVSARIRELGRFDRDEIYDRLVYKLSHYVLEEQVSHRTQEFKTRATATARVSAQARVEVEVPKTWWQHLKRDHFPEWFVRRWPVQTHKIVKTHRKHASKTEHHTEVHTADFREYAQFPAASIRTPERYRGPVFVRREELTTPSSFMENE